MDDYVKDGGLEAVRLLCSFYHDSLHALIIRNVNNFDLISIYQTKGHGKNYIYVRPPLIHHLYRNRLLAFPVLQFDNWKNQSSTIPAT